MKAFVKVKNGLVVGVSMRDYKGDLAPCEFEFEYQGEIRPLILPAGGLGDSPDFGAYAEIKRHEAAEMFSSKPAPKAPEKQANTFTRPCSFSDEGLPICLNCSGSGSMCSPSGDNPRTCQICDGKGIYPAGKVKCQSCDGWGQSSVDGLWETCPDCKGSALMDSPKLVSVAGQDFIEKPRPHVSKLDLGDWRPCGRCEQTGVCESMFINGIAENCTICGGLGWVDVGPPIDASFQVVEEPKAPLHSMSVDFSMTEQDFTRQLVEAGGKIGAMMAEEKERRLFDAFEKSIPAPDPATVLNELGETPKQALARMLGAGPGVLFDENTPGVPVALAASAAQKLERAPIFLTPGGPDDISAKALEKTCPDFTRIPIHLTAKAAGASDRTVEELRAEHYPPPGGFI